MNLTEEYIKNKKNIFAYDSDYLDKLRKNLINNFDLGPKNLKNNESIKHFDLKILQDFKYIPLISDSFSPKVSNNKENFFSINEKKEFFVNKIKEHQNDLEDDYLVKLNTIFHNSGYLLNIAKNSKSLINIDNISNDESSVFSKNFINADNNSDLIIIEKFNNNVQSNMNIINFFHLSPNSKILHLVLQENKKNSNLQFTNYANCHEGSSYIQLVFNFSSSSIRNHNYTNLLGTNSHADLHGVFLANGNQIIDNKTVVNHFSPSCSSNQNYKGILTDEAKASYLSKTYVDKKAQKTEAYQLSKGILLSENSYFHSKPELKIYADDVKCSHGSTIGPFDKDILYYMKSRGIPNDVGISLLIKSFFSDIIEKSKNKEFIQLLNISIDNWLNSNIY